jgi:hypothetical protein
MLWPNEQPRLYGACLSKLTLEFFYGMSFLYIRMSQDIHSRIGSTMRVKGEQAKSCSNNSLLCYDPLALWRLATMPLQRHIALLMWYP